MQRPPGHRSLWILLLAPFWTVALGQPDGPLLIRNVTVIDGTGRPPLANRSVWVQGNRIERISRDVPQVGAETRVVDGTNRYLVPGFMDVHVHIRGGRGNDPDTRAGRRALHSYLYAGITSVYDAGNQPDFILGLRRQERAGDLVAPRIFATGGIVTYPGSHGSSTGATLIDDWPEALPALREHVGRKPDLVKLTYEERGWGSRPMIPLLPQELMRQVIEFYNQHGIRSTVHASSERRARQAIAAGTDTLAHPVIQGPVTQEFANLMGAKRVPMASTLTIGENYSRLADDPSFLDQPLYQATIEADEIRRLKTEESDRQRARPWTGWMKIMTPIAQENLRMIHQAGGVVALGTDQTLGPAAHREMELLVAAGIPPLAVLRIATLNAAVFLGKEAQLGSIEEGKLADLVLLDANPLENIDNAKRIVLVVKDGRVVDRSALDLPINRR